MKRFNKSITAFLLCGLVGNTLVPMAQASGTEPTVKYQTITDAKTGRQIEYFDLGEHTTRTYVSQNAWFSDNKSFIIGTKSNLRLYKYDTTTHTVKQMFDDLQTLDNSAVVDPTTDTVYAKNNNSTYLYKQSLKQLEDAEVKENGITYNINFPNTEATSGSWYGNEGIYFWFSTSSKNNAPENIGGRDCRVQKGDRFYFKLDAISKTQRNVTISFDYYDYASKAGQKIKMLYYSEKNNVWSTVSANYIEPVTYTGTNTWKTATIPLTDAMFGHDPEWGDVLLECASDSLALSSFSATIPAATGNQISYEVNSDGTSATGDLLLRRWSPVTWPKASDHLGRGIMLNGESVDIVKSDGSKVNYPVLSNIGGKGFMYNVPNLNTDETYHSYWRNNFFFDIPETFLSGSGSYAELDIEYYAPSKGGTVNLFTSASNGDTTEDSNKCFKTSKTVSQSSNGNWETLSFLIPKSAVLTDGWYSSDLKAYSNLKIMPQDLQLYIHKITIKKYSDYDCLGWARGSWLPHVGSNGDISLVTGEDKKLIVYDASRESFDPYNVYANVTHGIINPKYPNLILYNHEKKQCGI